MPKILLRSASLVEAEAPRYGAIETPTVVVTGDADEVLSPEIYAKAMVAAVPGAKLIVLPGVGHMVQFAAAERIVRPLLNYPRPSAPRRRQSANVLPTLATASLAAARSSTIRSAFGSNVDIRDSNNIPPWRGRGLSGCDPNRSRTSLPTTDRLRGPRCSLTASADMIC